MKIGIGLFIAVVLVGIAIVVARQKSKAPVAHEQRASNDFPTIGTVVPDTAELLRVQAIQRQVCVSNLRQLESGLRSWAAEHPASSNENLTLMDLDKYFRVGVSKIACPTHGTYSVTKANAKPMCSIAGHTL